ncbi:MAG: Do family serine endopeptidase [Bdellovibrionales bacterium]
MFKKSFFTLLTLGFFYFQNPEAHAQSYAMKLSDPLPANIFIELNKLVNPAVVSISTSSKAQVFQRPRSGDPFFDFFEEFMGPQNDRGPRPAQALGTGFIIESDGLIVTNTHVVNAATEIKVQMSGDKKLYDAELVGKDERSDVALIRVKSAGKNLPTVKLGSSDLVQVGEWVAAFGNPFGHTDSMSKGIISAKGRSIKEINAYPFLQTDASINPGNSGGPLVNMKGEVIGVNTAIDARAQGIGFAIPIDSVKTLLPQLKEKGRISRGFLGVALADLDFRSAQQLGLKSPEGALIVNVVPASPADKGGIKLYDVITKFGEREVKSARDLSNAVLDQPVGKPVTVEMIRNGRSTKVTLHTIESNKEKPRVTVKPKSISGEETPYNLGFKLARLTTNVAKDLQMSYQKREPPVVTEILPGSPASNSNLRVGDVILDVNRMRVDSVKSVQQNLKEGVNVLRIQRGEMVSLVFIEGPTN